MLSGSPATALGSFPDSRAPPNLACKGEFEERIMTRKPIEPAPDTIDPHAPPEAPAIACPTEAPGTCSPEYSCPPSPSYTPDSSPIERPTPED
jgi:hypothetical protein